MNLDNIVDIVPVDMVANYIILVGNYFNQNSSI